MYTPLICTPSSTHYSRSTAPESTAARSQSCRCRWHPHTRNLHGHRCSSATEHHLVQGWSNIERSLAIRKLKAQNLNLNSLRSQLYFTIIADCFGWQYNHIGANAHSGAGGQWTSSGLLDCPQLGHNVAAVARGRHHNHDGAGQRKHRTLPEGLSGAQCDA